MKVAPMTQSEKTNKDGNGAPFLAGPKPAAPIPRYEPGSNESLRNRLRASTAETELGEPQYISDAGDLSIAGIEGKIDRKKANVAARIVESDPDQALRVIRNWLLGT